MGFLFKAECSMIITTGVTELIKFSKPFSCRPQAIQNSFQPFEPVFISVRFLVKGHISLDLACISQNSQKAPGKAPENDFGPGKSRIILPRYFWVPEISPNAFSRAYETKKETWFLNLYLCPYDPQMLWYCLGWCKLSALQTMLKNNPSGWVRSND